MQQLSEFQMTQKITALVNRYVITDPGGVDVFAFAEQKRFMVKEEVSLWAGEDRSEALGGFKARQVVGLGAAYDVTGPDGSPIGAFRKDAKASLLRSTWHLTQGPEGAGPAARGTERSLGIALARRGWEIVDAVLPFPLPVPFVYHFDFVRDGEPVMSVERKIGFRDQYVIRIQDPALDRRLAFCMAVALDALQSR